MNAEQLYREQANNLLQQAVTLSQLANSAKTVTKRQFYTKKAKKINMKLANLLVEIQKFKDLKTKVKNELADQLD